MKEETYHFSLDLRHGKLFIAFTRRSIKKTPLDQEFIDKMEIKIFKLVIQNL